MHIRTWREGEGGGGATGVHADTPTTGLSGRPFRMLPALPSAATRRGRPRDTSTTAPDRPPPLHSRGLEGQGASRRGGDTGGERIHEIGQDRATQHDVPKGELAALAAAGTEAAGS